MKINWIKVLDISRRALLILASFALLLNLLSTNRTKEVYTFHLIVCLFSVVVSIIALINKKKKR